MIKLKNIFITVLFSLTVIFALKIRLVTLNAALGLSYIELFSSLKRSIADFNIKQQDLLLSGISSNFDFKKVLDNLFNGNKDEILNYLLQFDNYKFIKKYFNVLHINEIKSSEISSILDMAIKKGALSSAAVLMEKCNIKPSQSLVVNNFNVLSKVTNVESINNFVAAMTKKGLMKTLLDERELDDKSLKALIHYAGINCNLAWLRILLKKNVPAQLQDYWKNTPMHLAVLSTLPAVSNSGVSDNKVQSSSSGCKNFEDKVTFVSLILKKQKITSLYKNRDEKTAYDFSVMELKKHENELKNTKSLIEKDKLEKKVNVYKKLVSILGKVEID